jgi:hypothetical protein
MVREFRAAQSVIAPAVTGMKTRHLNELVKDFFFLVPVAGPTAAAVRYVSRPGFNL